MLLNFLQEIIQVTRILEVHLIRYTHKDTIYTFFVCSIQEEYHNTNLVDISFPFF